MNKKHIHPILLAGTLLLAACQQEEILPPSGDASVITFQSPYTVDTRSYNMREGAFTKGDKVGVLGFCKATNVVNGNTVDYSTSLWDTKKDFASPDVFYNQELTYEGTGMWTYDWTEGITYENSSDGTFDGKKAVGTLHPWSSKEDDTFAFFAYYPYADLKGNNGTYTGTIECDTLTTKNAGLGTITLSGIKQTGDPTITYTMPHSCNSINSGLEWWIVPDLMLAYKVDHLKEDGTVRLNFRHLFCSFEFQINNYTDQEIVVEDMYIYGGTATGEGDYGSNNETPTGGFYSTVSVKGQESGYTVGEDFYVGRFHLVGRTTNDTQTHVLVDVTCPAATTDSEGNVIPGTTSINYEGKPISLLFIPDADGKLTTNGNSDIRIAIQITSNNTTLISQNEKRSMNLENISFTPGVRSIFNINVIGNDFYVQMRSDGAWEDGTDSTGNDIIFE